jgi:pSer/pThr/pTyr-binding forkhead associated (FHA) protein
VRDLGSTNGVKVNGQRIRDAQPLRDGDTIQLGLSEITFESG